MTLDDMPDYLFWGGEEGINKFFRQNPDLKLALIHARHKYEDQTWVLLEAEASRLLRLVGRSDSVRCRRHAAVWDFILLE